MRDTQILTDYTAPPDMPFVIQSERGVQIRYKYSHGTCSGCNTQSLLDSWEPKERCELEVRSVAQEDGDKVRSQR